MCLVSGSPLFKSDLKYAAPEFIFGFSVGFEFGFGRGFGFGFRVRFRFGVGPGFVFIFGLRFGFVFGLSCGVFGFRLAEKQIERHHNKINGVFVGP